MRRGPEFGHEDKEKVRAAAAKKRLQRLWLDDKGLWHGAKDASSIPSWAKAQEEVVKRWMIPNYEE